MWTGAFQQRSEGLAGQLKSIKLENFMCHQNFSMDFGPHVTFINGTNGSGKSAVLQGLQFCLGMQAGKTGRGSAFGPESRPETLSLCSSRVPCDQDLQFRLGMQAGKTGRGSASGSETRP